MEEHRGPDKDLQAYLQNNPEFYTRAEVLHVWATVAGHNDEDNWYWIVQLRSSVFYLTRAWCDHTGWQCQSGGESWLATSAEDAAAQAPETEEYTGRKIRWNLLRQVRGEQPYGLEEQRF